MRFRPTPSITAEPEHPYVSRGGVKLAAALDHFASNVTGRICLDVGASTGGFTEVLLARGARRVYAIDVGSGQLHPRLRGRDDIVVSIEQTDIRNLDPSRLPEPPDFATIDVSFISLKLVLPAVGKLLAPRAQILALIKPQFEAGRRDSKKGVVRDEAVHKRSATTSPPLSRRSAGASAASCRRRSSAATATANSSSRPNVVEHLIIDHVGHRGDGVADGRRWTDLCSGHACPAKPSKSSRCPVSPTGGISSQSKNRARNASRRSVRISASAAAAPCSIGRTTPYRAWKRGLVVEALRQAGIEAPVGELDRRPRRRPPPRRVPCAAQQP